MPWSEYCDGVIDCATKNDEENCRPRTCADWWNAGYRDRKIDLIRKFSCNNESLNDK